MVPRSVWLLVVAGLMQSAIPTVVPSAELDPDSSRTSSAPSPGMILRLERRPPLAAARVEPRANGLIVVIGADGTRRAVASSRIVSITDARGTDLTREVIQRGHAFGVPGWGESGAPSSRTRWVESRFRAGPGSICGSFFLTEWSLARGIGNGNETGDGHDVYETVDIGAARNIGARHSLGGTLFIGAGENHQEFGLRGRIRRWLTSRAALDLSPGFVFAANWMDEETPRLPALTAQAGLSFEDRIGVTIQMLRTRHRYRVPVGPPAFFEPNYRLVERTENRWYAGFKLGAEPGLLAVISAIVFTNLLVGPGHRIY